MEPLSKLSGENKSEETPFVVSITDGGVTINGVEITFPTTLPKLVEIFGEPTRHYRAEERYRVIWDNHGVSTSYATSTHIPIVCFFMEKEEMIKHLPVASFKGQILINGKPIEEIPETDIRLTRNTIIKSRYMGDENNVMYGYNLSYNIYFKEDTQKNKYKLPEPTGKGIPFTDFNFKLTVIQELMYNRKLLRPKFDVYEFAEVCNKRKIDIDKEGCEPIPEVIEYFKKLEISKKLAKHITEIYQDGGNEIYAQIIPLDWSGSDDYFDIQSSADVVHFPNLKKMTLFSTAPELYEELKEKGIDAKPL